MVRTHFYLALVPVLFVVGCGGLADRTPWVGQWSNRNTGANLMMDFSFFADGTFDATRIVGAQTKPEPETSMSGTWIVGPGSIVAHPTRKAETYRTMAADGSLGTTVEDPYIGPDFSFSQGPGARLTFESPQMNSIFTRISNTPVRINWAKLLHGSKRVR